VGDNGAGSSGREATMVELRRFELLTPSMRTRCATSCATAPTTLKYAARTARQGRRQD
jgi:hypothetical protein